eukprot:gene1318-1909_t
MWMRVYRYERNNAVEEFTMRRIKCPYSQSFVKLVGTLGISNLLQFAPKDVVQQVQDTPGAVQALREAWAVPHGNEPAKRTRAAAVTKALELLASYADPSRLASLHATFSDVYLDMCHLPDPLPEPLAQ